MPEWRILAALRYYGDFRHPAFPTSKAAFGLLIRALAAFLDAHPGDDGLAGQIVWLGPPELGAAFRSPESG